MQETAVRAARRAGRYLMGKLGRVRDIRFKGAVDIVTEADRGSEEMLTGMLSRAFPGQGIVAEEGTRLNPASAVQWIFDPLDGTTNYAHSYPCFCVSIGCEIGGVLTLGVVYDPSRDELFTARLGRGAHLNGRRIRVSKTPRLLHSILATGFPYVKDGPYGDNIGHFRNFLYASQGIRRGGSAALDLCYVACGRLDGYWEFNLRPWDSAAGALILTEAGGCVTKTDGSTYSIHVPELLATNGLLHAESLSVLARISPPRGRR